MAATVTKGTISFYTSHKRWKLTIVGWVDFGKHSHVVQWYLRANALGSQKISHWLFWNSKHFHVTFLMVSYHYVHYWLLYLLWIAGLSSYKSLSSQKHISTMYLAAKPATFSWRPPWCRWKLLLEPQTKSVYSPWFDHLSVLNTFLGVIYRQRIRIRHQPYAEAATWQEQLCSRCFYFNALAPALALEISGRWVDMSADQWGETSEP